MERYDKERERQLDKKSLVNSEKEQEHENEEKCETLRRLSIEKLKINYQDEEEIIEEENT